MITRTHGQWTARRFYQPTRQIELALVDRLVALAVVDHADIAVCLPRSVRNAPVQTDIALLLAP